MTDEGHLFSGGRKGRGWVDVGEDEQLGDMAKKVGMSRLAPSVCLFCTVGNQGVPCLDLDAERSLAVTWRMDGRKFLVASS